MKLIHTRKSDYNFKEMTDEQVVVIAQEEQNVFAIDYIVNKYKNFVRAKARSYFLVGADREDIIQEGMIGLYKATRDFKHDKLASFRAFAELCITRQIITAIKSATRQKHAPLNSYISFNKPVYTEDSERTLIEMLSSTKIKMCIRDSVKAPKCTIITYNNGEEIALKKQVVLKCFQLIN